MSSDDKRKLKKHNSL
uniref:Uncharacterized protein n=1 Tax=Arundo donax TaxID=35708 RepID=A0A0A9H913_ARUDO